MAMYESPWRHLPDGDDLIHPMDEPDVRRFNQNRRPDSNQFLHFDIVPEAFVGRPDAPVLLLSNNPGYASKDNAKERREPKFKAKMLRNLLHESLDYPFVFLDPILAGTYGHKWWRSKLKDLIDELGLRRVSTAVLNVTYCPYASRRFGHAELKVFSTGYNHFLIREAIARNAVIVRMRTSERLWKMWIGAVPELANYTKVFRVKNPQAATLNRTNLEDDVYELIRDAIRLDGGS